MSRSLLDTNIISHVTKPVPSEALVAWMTEQSDEDLFISALTVVEIRRGILEKPAGKKRRELERWFSGPEGPQALFAGLVLPFDERPAWFGRGGWPMVRRKDGPPPARHDHRRSR